MKTALLVAVVLATHYGYQFVSDSPEQAAEAFYVLRGLEGTVLFFLLAGYIQSPLASMACWLGAAEEIQCFACGIDSSGITVPVNSGLCVEQYGYAPYAAFLAASVVFIWNRTHARRKS